MSATRAETVAYQARLYDRTTIFQVISAGWAGIGMVLSSLSFASAAGESLAAYAAGEAAGAQAAALGWDGVTLPIAAFMLGTSIRQQMDEEDDKRLQARILILRSAFGQAVEDHARAFPNSAIIDPGNDVTGLKILAGPRYVGVSRRFEIIHRAWSRTLDSDLEQWLGLSRSIGANFMAQSGQLESWAQFVISRFDRIRLDYQSILGEAEGASRG